MATQIDKSNNGRELAISGELTIYGVASVKQELWQVLTQHDEVEVDLAAVDEIDTAGLQLLLMAKRVPGRQVRFINHSPAVLQLIELSNVVLGDPLVISGRG